MRATIITLICVMMLCTSCMSGKQRYRLHSEMIKAEAAQARTYQPLVTKGKTTIVAEDGIAIVVPLEQTKFAEIPNDFETATDFAKFATGVGGAIIGVKELNKTRTTKVTNNNAPATP